MTRSASRLPFVDGYLLKKVEDSVRNGSTKPIKTKSRRSTILPKFVGLNFEVYNGKKYIPVHVKEEMINHLLGEFSPTRVFYGHGTKSSGATSDGAGSKTVQRSAK